MRHSHPGLDLLGLALILAAFVLADLGGWLLAWLLVALPVLPLGWLFGSVLPPGAVRELAFLGLEIASLGLTGLIGGAAFGLGGGLVLLGSLGRGEAGRAAVSPGPRAPAPSSGGR